VGHVAGGPAGGGPVLGVGEVKYTVINPSSTSILGYSQCVDGSLIIIDDIRGLDFLMSFFQYV